MVVERASASAPWGEAGQPLERSALVERLLSLQEVSAIERLPGTPALRRRQIKLQVALNTPLIHIEGYSAPETPRRLRAVIC